MPRSSIFTVGGTVQAGSGTYLPRRVDEELLALCRAGTFAFVLSARQMGKSSLMVRTAERLAASGTKAVVIDLSQIGVQVTPDAWHLGLLTTIEDALDLETDVFAWWEAHSHLGYGQRLTQFFERVLLVEVPGPVVLFIDEIDTTLSLDFTDDFFAAIRFVYNARASVPAYSRLTFVLIGVATPGDLISDPRRTPFNVGQRVDVEYFTLAEAKPLTRGFQLPPAEAEAALTRVFHWTAGHPYLTQRLCAVIAEEHPRHIAEADVDRAVAVAFLGDRSEQDTNLRFVHDMLTRRAPDRVAVLTTYRYVLDGRTVPDDGQSVPVVHLKLSGVVGGKGGRLAVRNPVYAAVFTRAWVKEQWPAHWIWSIPPVVRGLVAGLFVALVLLALFLVQKQQTNQVEAERMIEAAKREQAQARMREADSLRALTEAANVALINQRDLTAELAQETDRVNIELAAAARRSDSLLQVSAAVNGALLRQIGVSDSLRAVAEVANGELVRQVALADSLRGVAEERLGEAGRARRETITIALASKAVRQMRRGDAPLGALLARQALHFSREGAGEFLDPIYDALRQTLNALTGAGGPRVMEDYQGGVRAVAFSPDGVRAAAADEAGMLVFWGDGPARRRPAAHPGGVRALTFSPDGTLLATGGEDHHVRLWRTLADPMPVNLGQLDGAVWAVAFSPDGRFLAAAGAEADVHLWSLSGRLERVRLPGPAGGRIRAVAFSPDGRRLVAAREDGVMAVWEGPAPDRPPRTYAAGLGRLHTLAFSPDGRLLAAGGDVPLVRLWRVQPSGDLQPLEALRGHEGPVLALAFSPDGARLATGSADHSVQVWQVARLRRSPIILQAHRAWVHTLAFSPEGTRLATGGADRSLRVWNIDPGRLAAGICRAVAGRELTPAEWSQFVGEDFPYERDYAPCTPVGEPSGGLP